MVKRLLAILIISVTSVSSADTLLIEEHYDSIATNMGFGELESLQVWDGGDWVDMARTDGVWSRYYDYDCGGGFNPVYVRGFVGDEYCVARLGVVDWSGLDDLGRWHLVVWETGSVYQYSPSGTKIGDIASLAHWSPGGPAITTLVNISSGVSSAVAALGVLVGVLVGGVMAVMIIRAGFNWAGRGLK